MANKSKKVGITSFVIIAVAMALILTLSILVSVLALTKYDNILEQFIGKSSDSVRGDTLGADVDYVKSDFGSARELYAYEEDVCANIALEGTTLLENKQSSGGKNMLPLAKGTELSLFSHSSVDLVSGGSGSGSGSFELTADLKKGLESAGLKVNDRLWKFYSSGKGASYKRGVGVINYGASLDWSINECPLSVIKSEFGENGGELSDTVAMYVFSRTGGEGGDEARDMAAFGGKAGNHYLEPDDTELEILSWLNRNFEDIILLVNCNNAPELGWVKDFPNIRAVVNFPGGGRTGTYGLGRMLTGLDKDGKEVSPSGHLVDTFVYDNFSSPAMRNMGDYRYDGTNYYYVDYAEGIYVGYKYYETRYADYVCGAPNVGEYDYSETVLYPFGYGLSYTKFVWSNYSVSAPDANGDITVSINVRNAGDRPGKDVVQVYVQSPYTQYDRQHGVEKSAVTLVGFAKTSLIGVDGNEDVTIKVNLRDFASYDRNGAGTYILEEGTYFITAASDAHSAVNNILLSRASRGDDTVIADRMVGSGDASLVGVYENALFDDVTYSRFVNGDHSATIGNLFGYAELKDGDAKYLSRTDWRTADGDTLRYGSASNVSSGAEIGGKQWSHSVTAELKAELDSFSSRNPSEGHAGEKQTFGAKHNLDLVDLRGLPFDDEKWDELLSQVTLSELAKLIDESGYCTPEVKSVNKPKITDLDGPAGLNKVVGHGSADIGGGLYAMTWPTEYMLACTWSEELAEEMGRGMGEDGLYSGVVGWYGPGMNIHRTPFAGRNFEYYSEDSFISGVLGKAEVNGAAQKGMYAFIKHFALNDQETHRDHLGIVTWADEQTIREIYLKPFEMCIRDNNVTVKYNEPVKEGGEITGYTPKTATVPATSAVMSSFNRIGATWAGGNYDLITRLLREEWGFNGFVLTDYEVPTYMKNKQTLAAGGDAKLKTVDMTNLFKSSFSLKDDVEYQNYAREAAHRIFYTVVNSAAMNGYVHGVEYVPGFAYYKIIIIVLDVVSAIGIGLLTWLLVVRILKFKKQKNVGEAEASEGVTETPTDTE